MKKNFDKIKKVAHRIKPPIDKMGMLSLKAEINEIEKLVAENANTPKLINRIQQL